MIQNLSAKFFFHFQNCIQKLRTQAMSVTEMQGLGEGFTGVSGSKCSQVTTSSYSRSPGLAVGLTSLCPYSLQFGVIFPSLMPSSIILLMAFRAALFGFFSMKLPITEKEIDTLFQPKVCAPMRSQPRPSYALPSSPMRKL